MGLSITTAILFLIVLCLNQIKEQNFLKSDTLLNQEVTKKNKMDLPNQTKNKKNIIIKRIYYSLRNKLLTNTIVGK